MAYFIFDPEDPWNCAAQCPGEADLREYLGHFHAEGPLPTIVEYELDGFARDVTEQWAEKLYASDRAEEDDAFGIPTEAEMRNWHHSRV